MQGLDIRTDIRDILTFYVNFADFLKVEHEKKYIMPYIQKSKKEQNRKKIVINRTRTTSVRATSCKFRCFGCQLWLGNTYHINFLLEIGGNYGNSGLEQMGQIAKGIKYQTETF